MHTPTALPLLFNCNMEVTEIVNTTADQQVPPIAQEELTSFTIPSGTKPTLTIKEESIPTTNEGGTSPTAKEKKPKKDKPKKEKAPAAPKPSAIPFHEQLGQRLSAQSREATIPTPAKHPSHSSSRVNSTQNGHQSSSGLLVPSSLGIRLRHRSRSRSPSPAVPNDGNASDTSVSTGPMSDIEARDPAVNTSLKDSLYNLDDMRRLEAINRLIAQYGTVSHMSVRDPSYSFWLNKSRTAAVHFKLLNKVAVLAGDPLCAEAAMPATLEEFERYCRKAKWKTSVIGASAGLMQVAKLKGWPIMRFGTEKVLNPVTNEVLLGKSGKRTVVQCRQLLEPTKGGLKLHIYVPECGRDPVLEGELTKLYDTWREDRNTNRDCQAFITVFEMFALPNLMTFIYTRTKEGAINGFAALRKMGTTGYHIDPFIQSADAPRGTSDLLIYASLAHLHALDISYLGIGHEPVSEPNELYNMSSLVINATRRIYKHIFGRLPVGGKETFNSRWKPDEAQEAGLYLIFVGKRTPSPKHLLAMTHFANISLRNVVKADWKDLKQEVSKNIRVPVPDPSLVAQGSTNVFIDVEGQRPNMWKSVSSPAAM